MFGLKEALGDYGVAGGKEGEPDGTLLCGVGAIFSDIPRG